MAESQLKARALVGMSLAIRFFYLWFAGGWAIFIGLFLISDISKIALPAVLAAMITGYLAVFIPAIAVGFTPWRVLRTRPLVLKIWLVYIAILFVAFQVWKHLPGL